MFLMLSEHAGLYEPETATATLKSGTEEQVSLQVPHENKSAFKVFVTSKKICP